jgi:hypothetical protein
MSIGLAYYILLLIWLAFGFWQGGFGNRTVIGGNLLLFILFVLLGWHDFGPPIHG